MILHKLIFSRKTIYSLVSRKTGRNNQCKYILTITTAFLLLLLATPPVFAQGAGIEWDILNQELMELYLTGKYDRAVVVAKKALEVAEKNVGPNHPDVAQSLNNLAELYRIQGQYAEAEPLYKRALAIDEKALGPNHSVVATDLNNVALLYYTQGQYAEAEPLLKRALAIDEKALGPQSLCCCDRPEQRGLALLHPGPVRRGRAALKARVG